ncbi:sugar kinase [Maritalea sp.]|uniref:sugar kinase n=1 Tax=Maritalea sp. TaxID=2003361 RepID=UPI003EF4DEBE
MPEIKSVVAVGEIMLELSGVQQDGSARLGFGGDTGNTAIYLSRLFGAQGRVGYLTRLGQSRFSNDLAAYLHGENIGLSEQTQADEGTPGLYAISTDEAGERSFTYWRESAAVRLLLTGNSGEDERTFLHGFDSLYLSGITLAVLSDEGRAQLLDIARTFLQTGKKVMFDVNFRANLWQSHSPHVDVPELVRKFIAAATIVKIGRDEGEVLFGVSKSSRLIEKLRLTGSAQLVVTDGGDQICVYDAGEVHEVGFDEVVDVVDSTAAGDSFSAGYLHAYLNGKAAQDCVKAGQKLAAVVIKYSGAIIPQDAMPK